MNTKHHGNKEKLDRQWLLVYSKTTENWIDGVLRLNMVIMLVKCKG